MDEDDERPTKATSKPTPRQTAEVLQLYDAGLTRNRIAEVVGVQRTTVSQIVRDSGRTMTVQTQKLQQMTALAREKNAERRARLATRMLEVAETFVEDTGREALVYAFGGRDNDYNEHLLSKPPPSDIRHLVQSAGIAVRSSIELDKHDGNTAGEEKSLLAELGRALGVVTGPPVTGEETP